jgi:predicted PurR-regulated permease PerM
MEDGCTLNQRPSPMAKTIPGPARVTSNMNELSSDEPLFARNGGWSRARFRAIGVAALAGLGVYLCYRLAQPCLPALVWAGALALVFTPMHRRVEAKVARPNLAAALSLVIIGLLVVAPTTWFAQKFAEQATSVPQSIQKQIAVGKWRVSADKHPQVARFLAFVEQQATSTENGATATAWLRTLVSGLIKESALAAVQVSLMFYFLFYFLRDRNRVLRDIRFFLPLSDHETDAVFSRVNETIQASLYGMLALSALQGVLGGLMYWLLGIPSPYFWALVMAAFAFVPVVDTIVVWIPAVVYLGLEGRWAAGLVVAGLGSLAIRVIINVLYPVLVKNRLRVPSVGLFIALLGGVILFGWSGLVLGPVVLTATSALLEICAKRMG